MPTRAGANLPMFGEHASDIASGSPVVDPVSSGQFPHEEQRGSSSTITSSGSDLRDACLLQEVKAAVQFLECVTGVVINCELRSYVYPELPEEPLVKNVRTIRPFVRTTQ